MKVSKRFTIFLVVVLCSVFIAQASECVKENHNAINEDAKWKKNEDGSQFWLYINGDDVTPICKVLLSESDYMLYQPFSKTVYHLKDFKSKSVNEMHSATGFKVTSENGFWFKFTEIDGSEHLRLFDIYGELFDFTTINEFHKNDDNYIGEKVDGTKIVLENTQTMGLHLVNSIVDYNAKRHGKVVDNSTKINKIASSKEEPKTTMTTKANSANYTWKKDDKSSYWFYKNGQSKSGFKSVWNGDSLIIIDKEDNTIVSLRGYKNGNPNVTYKGYALNVDITYGFWIKFSSTRFSAYNSNGELISKNVEINTWSSDGKDVVIKPVGDPNTYKLRDFKTAEGYKIFSLELKD